MKKLINTMVFGGGMLLALNVNSQVTVFDDLSTAPTTSTTSYDSDTFQFCNNTEISYNLSTPSGGNFIHASSSGNGSLVNGVIFPANTGTNLTQVEIVFTFADPINTLSVRIHDLDGVGNAETISGISPAYSSLTNATGTLVNPGSSTVVEAIGDNSSGWIHWNLNTPTTTFTLQYNRPGQGYGLVIDEVEFSCEETVTSGCICNPIVVEEVFGQTTVGGTNNSTVLINTLGELVSSVTIELPSYVSTADNTCLRCDVGAQELFGTIQTSSTISGVQGVLFDPYGLGHSRKLVFNFPAPIAINQSVDIIMQFPPVLALSCCKNKVSFCLDVTLKKEDCSTCEYTLCNTSLDNKAVPAKSNGIYQDFPLSSNGDKQKGLEISPNPASSFVQINVVNENFLGTSATISSSAGRIIRTIKLSRKITQFNVEDLSSGLYFITVNTIEGEENYNLVVE